MTSSPAPSACTGGAPQGHTDINLADHEGPVIIKVCGAEEAFQSWWIFAADPTNVVQVEIFDWEVRTFVLRRGKNDFSESHAFGSL